MTDFPIDPKESAIHALKSLQPGNRYIYYTGFLDIERLDNPDGPASIIAGIAFQLMEEGKVHLTQKRIGPPSINGNMIDWKIGIGRGFQYIATGAHPRTKPVKPYNRALVSAFKRRWL